MSESEDTGTGLILVADDDATQRILSRQYLETSGFSVVEAEDGARAVEVFKDAKPDMVLLDVRMPHLDGFEVCEYIRQHPEGAEVPVIMVTGLEDLVSIERSYVAGATDFITKPVVWETLGQRARYLMRAGNAIRALKLSESRLAQAQRVARLGSWEWDFARGELSCSPEVFKLLPVDSETLPSSLDELLEYVHPDDRARIQDLAVASLSNAEPMLAEFRLNSAGSGEVTVEQQAEPVFHDDGSPLKLIGTIQDISERKKAERKIHELAFYDSLTQLPNRELFRKRAERALRGAARSNRTVALLFLDLDGFKYINDTMGHAAGDELLCTVADYLQRSVRASDIVATLHSPIHYHASISRIGGDEFAILLDDLHDPSIAAKVAERVLVQLREPTQIGGKEFSVTGSIGIAMFPENADSVDGLLKNADIAMYHSKQGGRNTFRFYAQHMQDSVQRRLSMEGKLKRALERDEFCLHYQAKADLSTGRVVGVEALLRWTDAELGQVSPAQFVPVAEDSGLIVPIGEWVLMEACRQASAWREQGIDELKMAVNLSSLQFNRGGLVDSVERALNHVSLQAHLLELELTESVIMENAEETIQILEQLKSMGLTLSVDDFGTGYSSMAYLKRFPLDVVKIDQSFIRDISFDLNDIVIIRAMIALAHGLNLSCIAEGVETEQQLEVLKSFGCDHVQGYLINKPMPAEEMVEFLKTNRRQPLMLANEAKAAGD